MNLSRFGGYQESTAVVTDNIAGLHRSSTKWGRGYHVAAVNAPKGRPTVIIAAAEAPPLVAELGIVLAATAVFGYLAERLMILAAAGGIATG